LFDIFYGENIVNLINGFNIIVTYCKGNFFDLLNNNLTIIKIKNKGYDIGGKLCALEYINNENKLYNYILFLHSKSNKYKRKQYFNPLIKNKNRIKLIKKYLKEDPNLYGIFPNIWNEEKVYYSKNINYINDILHFLEIKDDYKIFSEGNCFICNKKVIDYIFNNNYSLFYNLLNSNNSFDINWVKLYYNLNLCDDNELYNYYLVNNLIGNDGNKRLMPDGMIEHVFERIWLNVIKKINGNYLILNNNT
jgi:hypothetical protein